MKKTLEILPDTEGLTIHTVNGVDTRTAAVYVRELKDYVPLPNGINAGLGDDIIEVLAKTKKTLWNQGVWREIIDGHSVTGIKDAIASITGDDIAPSCGTAMCFAGWSGELSAANWVTDMSMVIQESARPGRSMRRFSGEDSLLLVTNEEYLEWDTKRCDKAALMSFYNWLSISSETQAILRERGFSSSTHAVMHVQEYALMVLGLVHGDWLGLFDEANGLKRITRIWSAYKGFGPVPSIEAMDSVKGKKSRWRIDTKGADAERKERLLKSYTHDAERCGH